MKVPSVNRITIISLSNPQIESIYKKLILKFFLNLSKHYIFIRKKNFQTHHVLYTKGRGGTSIILNDTNIVLIFAYSEWVLIQDLQIRIGKIL